MHPPFVFGKNTNNIQHPTKTKKKKQKETKIQHKANGRPRLELAATNFLQQLRVLIERSKQAKMESAILIHQSLAHLVNGDRAQDSLNILSRKSNVGEQKKKRTVSRKGLPHR